MKNMKKILLSIIVALMITPSFTQGVWIQQNDFPGAARTRAVCFAIGAYGYFYTYYLYMNLQYEVIV